MSTMTLSTLTSPRATTGAALTHHQGADMSRTTRVATMTVVRTAAGLTVAALALSACGSGSKGSSSDAGSGAGGKVKIGLITKTDTNPFFVKMKDGAEKAAKADGVDLTTAAGKFDGDNASQI